MAHKLTLAHLQVAGLGVVLSAITACSPTGPAPGPIRSAEPPTPNTAVAIPVPTVGVVEPAASKGGASVKIQVVGTLAEAAIYIATDRGYFAEQGISPQFVTFDSAARAIPALATGQLDVAAGVLSAGLFNAIGRGIDVRVVVPQSEERGCARSATWLLVRKDLMESGAVQTPKDLRGRKIALVSKGSTVEYFADALLYQGGLQPTDAEYVEMSFGDMGAAFASRAIDVAVGAEPTATSYAERGLAAKWLCGADIIPNFQYTYLLYSGQFANHQTNLAQRWMAAYVRGARDWQKMLDTGEGKDEIFASLSNYTPVKDRMLLDRVSLPLISPEDPVDVASVQNQITWALQRGYITKAPAIATLVDTRFIERSPQPQGH
jgi:NitT/TauT family transport system substrate-binding protein